MVVLFILGAIFLLFESYTSYFRFSRLESAATLLYQKAEEIDSPKNKSYSWNLKLPEAI